jgi:hypothetical protein
LGFCRSAEEVAIVGYDAALLAISALEDGTTTLSQNVRNQISSNAATCSRRTNML